jgi:hypothetical protein
VTQRSFPYTGASAATELDWSKLVRSLGMCDGVFADDPAGLELKATANGTSTISVAAGSANVNGFFYESDAAVALSVPANGGGTARIDRIVLRSSQTANATTLTYVTGGTSAPALLADRTDVYDLPIAQVTVAAGSSVVPSGNVADQRWFYGKPVASSLTAARRNPTRNQLIVEGTGAAPSILIGTGSAWTQLWPPPAPTWISLPLASGWANYGAAWQSARYCKMVDGLVIVQGLVKITSNRPASNIIATLPAGYRPSAQHIFTVDHTDTSVHQRVDVRSDGALITYDALTGVGSYVTLSGIMFPAEA